MTDSTGTPSPTLEQLRERLLAGDTSVTAEDIAAASESTALRGLIDEAARLRAEREATGPQTPAAPTGAEMGLAEAQRRFGDRARGYEPPAPVPEFDPGAIAAETRRIHDFAAGVRR